MRNIKKICTHEDSEIYIEEAHCNDRHAADKISERNKRTVPGDLKTTSR